MDWTEIIAEVAAKDVERAENIAVMTVPYGIYIEDYSSLEEEVLEIAKIDLIDEELLAKNRETARIHIYISPEDNPAEATAFLEERFRAENINFKILTDKCDVEACLDNWKKYFYPIEIGEKLLIRPVWRDDYDPKGRTVLHLEPGIAFGTGTHETTRLCLEALEKYVNDGATVLDVGCGSGILAVASLLLGAKNAIGIDIDELAVKASVENAERNGVSERYTAIHGNLADEVTGTYDIITANIVADAIIMLSGDIEKHMHKDTVYIMSGIIDSRLEDVLSALPKTLKIIETRTDKGWYCLVAKLISNAE
ncbi:MAG: 50S ribosomal protein L11 methyltransferase [Candidatus Pseudoruminococcus sp.]|uniref:50S ribosomal protein L11 methyltransferase n=1 Tax=Candidatus Pseudoruminococcus sp. TaxID=3101048 RepID=UPI002A7D129F|nr:50S ribosomal protein L11 methyltransferase [Ruminococcus sp.]MDY2782111.1 50S ribosomal protein L11 methyltransferase [Candidatus Pseudoruminococcus sp.]